MTRLVVKDLNKEQEESSPKLPLEERLAKVESKYKVATSSHVQSIASLQIGVIGVLALNHAEPVLKQEPEK